MFAAPFLFLVLGAVVGSFVNVLVLRAHTGRGAGGRSGCLSCRATLSPADLIPIFSYIGLRGRCRACGSAISLQYPLVELVAALLFACIGFASLPLAEMLSALLIVTVLLAMAVYDLRHTILPDEWVYTFLVLAALHTVFATFPFTEWVWLLLGPVISALPLFILYAVSGGRWMGFGDVKLALGIGALLGPLYGIVAVFFAFIIGALVSVPLLFFSSDIIRTITPKPRFGKRYPRYTMKSEIAFGPFLITSCLLIWFSVLFHVPLPFLQF